MLVILMLMLLILPSRVRGEQLNNQALKGIETYLPSYLKPTPKEIKKPTPKHKVLRNKPSSLNFAWGHCTSFVASKKYITWMGNANQWLTQAKNQKYLTSKKPKVGAVCVENLSYWGHCSLVIKTKKNTFLVREANYCGLNVISERWILNDSPTIMGLIY